MRGGVYFFGGGQFILHPFSHFEMQDFKNSKSLGALIFGIHIFKFKMGAGLQVDIDINTEYKFSWAVSFHLSVGTQNQPNSRNYFLFYTFGAIKGPPNHPVSKARAFCVNVNKHDSY